MKAWLAAGGAPGVSGTALRPVRAVLADAEWEAFRDELTERLAGDYPVHHGIVDFPFPRVFAVARRA